MDAKVTILHAKPWSMVDEVTKQERSGVSVQYILSDSLAPNVDADTGELGYAVTKESISVEAAKALVEVPGLYDAEMVLRGKSGKNVLVLGTLKFAGK
ncbi:MAG: hypothetical protein IJY09_06370 [Lachnospiraceae bacterium]|nr:hypothetical protein [Lachnospiraceae bacterium]